AEVCYLCVSSASYENRPREGSIMRLRLPLAFVLLLVALSSASHVANAQTPGPTAALPGHVLPALVHATRIASAPRAAEESLTLTLVLHRSDEAAFAAFLRDQQDPRSTRYGQTATQVELAARFGPSQSSYDAVIAYLQNHGFTLLQGSDN